MAIYTQTLNRGNPLLRLPFSLFVFIVFAFVILAFCASLSYASGFLPWGGRVVDSLTGQPIEGALIVRSWDVEYATPFGTARDFFAVKEKFSDENGRFLIAGKLAQISIPFLSQVIENRPIIFKPGYKFIIIDKKISTIQLEKIPTLIELRNEELDNVRGNYEIDNSDTNILNKIVSREWEFIESAKPNEWYKTVTKDTKKKKYISQNPIRDNQLEFPTSPDPKRSKRLKTIETQNSDYHNEKFLKDKSSSPEINKYENDDKERAEVLIKALTDVNHRHRGSVATALSKMGIQDPILQEKLGKAVEIVINQKRRAYKAKSYLFPDSLGKLGAPAVEPLLSALNDEDIKIRVTAAGALGYTDDPRAVEPLIGALKENNIIFKKTVINSLRKLKDPRAVDALITELKSDDYKENIDRHVIELALIEMGYPAIEPTIKELRNKNWKVRKSAAYILGRVGNKKAVEPLINATRDINQEVLSEVATALGGLHDSKSVEALITLLDEEAPKVRKKAIIALSIIQDTRAVDPLINSLKKDSVYWVRESAAIALGKMNDKKVVDSLILAWNDKDSGVRTKAAEALVEAGEKAVTNLIAVLKYKDSYFRWRAAWTLGKIKHPSSVESLISLLNDEVPAVRWTVAGALSEIKNHMAIEALIKKLRDEDKGIRIHTIASLTRAGNIVIEPLFSVLENESLIDRSEMEMALHNMYFRNPVLYLLKLMIYKNKDSQLRAFKTLLGIGKLAIRGVKSFIVTKAKKGIEKKEEINYNICHTHPGHDVGCRLWLYYVDHAQI